MNRKETKSKTSVRFIPKEAGLYTVEEIAAFLEVPPSWVYDRTRRGAIPVRRVGKYCRFDISEVDAWNKSGCPANWREARGEIHDVAS